MSLGIKTYSATGAINYDSTALGFGNFTNGYQVVTAQTTLTPSGISFPKLVTGAAGTESMVYTFSGYPLGGFIFTVAGYENPFTDTTVYAPSFRFTSPDAAGPFYTGFNISSRSTMNMAPTFGLPFGVRYLEPLSGWGLYIEKNNGYTVISPTNRMYSVHPTSGGSLIRTGVANSAVGEQTYSGGLTLSTNNTPQNVTFDKPYDQPPLIVLTASDGPVALLGMRRDGSGKYVGAVVVAGRTLSTYPGRPYSFGMWTPHTYNFSYVIVSTELPMYPQSSPNGIKMWDSAGVEIFNSSERVTTNTVNQIIKPFYTVDAKNGPPTWPYTLSNFQQQYNSSQSIDSSKIGVVLNNFSALTGVMCIPDQGSPIGSGIYFGIVSGYGRYVTVSSSLASFTSAGTWVWEIITYDRGESWDFASLSYMTVGYVQYAY
jgi:hypothetical protein